MEPLQMPIIEAKQISKSFGTAGQPVTVLDNLSMSIFPGEFLVIKGNSGSGKSTLLSVLSGLDRPTSGRIFIENQDITDTPEDDLAQMRNTTFGFVFQSFHLVPSLTAVENVMFPAELKKDPNARQRADALLKRVAMGHRKNHFPHQLSGGEKQQSLLFVFCVALSISTIVAVSGFSQSVDRLLKSDAKSLHAADVMVRSSAPVSPSLLQVVMELENRGLVQSARTWEFYSVVRSQKEDVSLLAGIKVVESGYPFYGQPRLASGRSFRFYK